METKNENRVIEFFNSYNNFIIASHIQPDGDAICSTLALSSILQQMGKNSILYNEGPFTPAIINQYENSFTTSFEALPIGEFHTKKFALVIVDCNEIGRIGKASEKKELTTLPTLVIDHHATSSQRTDQNLLYYVDSSSPSTTLLINELASLLKIKLTTEAAKQLLFGFCTDSGFFRFINQHQHKYLKGVASLIEAGGNLKECYSKLSGLKTLEQKRYFSLLISRVVLYFNQSVAITYEELDDFSYFSLNAKDADLLYRELFSIDSIEAIFYLKQKEENCYVVGFRSRDKIDVGTIAASFGGGGHKLAAGATIKGTKDSIIKALLDKLQENSFSSI